MNGNDLKQLLKLSHEDGNEKKKLPKLLVWCILIAIVFLALGGFSGGEKGKEISEKPNNEETFVISTYVAELEERLALVLESIDGVGKVRVFLNMESGKEQILAEDIKTVTEENKDNEDEEKRYERETVIVLSETDYGQNPHIIAEKLPQPSGVLVIAEGARSERIRMEIYEAVRAVFGLPAHRVKVSY